MKKLLITGMALAVWSTLLSQDNPAPQADFLMRMSGAHLEVQPLLPPLQQIAGAPPAFYEYYWEFGDGTYSFEESPTHLYRDTSAHEVLLLATGKYDNGKAPRSRKRSAKPKKAAAREEVASTNPLNALQHESDWLGLKAVRSPRPGEELILILSYANRSPLPQSGRLEFAYNENAYSRAHFRWQEARTHHGEAAASPLLSQNQPRIPTEAWSGNAAPTNLYELQLPASPAQLQSRYREQRAWSFSGLQPGEVRNLFLSLQATEDMLADTNAIITVEARLTTDDGRVDESFPLEMEIVASHDPNYIAVSDRRLNYRRARQNDLSYKVHFQNTGEGPASRVEIQTDLPPGYSAESLRILETQPAVPLCPEAPASWSCLDTAYQDGQLVLTFRNIYLPGTRQEGVGQRDSTQGYVKYRLSPGKAVEKRPFSARAAIIFDQNPPIRTGRAATRFKAGWSPGLLAGRRFSSDGEGAWQFGLSLAPFSPHRLFWQVELWAGLPTEQQSSNSSRDTVRTENDLLGLPFVATVDTITQQTQTVNTQVQTFALTPLQARYNLSGWIGLGTGLMLELEYRRSEQTTQAERFVRIYDPDGQELTDLAQSLSPAEQSETTAATNLYGSWFAEVQLGKVRQGPALGIRGVLPFDARPAYGLAFLQWRF